MRGRAAALTPAASYGLAVLAGVLGSLAFPRAGLWPLAFVAATPLMLALRGCGPRGRFLRGWLAGAVFTILLQHWFAGMLERMSGFSRPAAAAVLVLYAGVVGLQWAVFALGYGWLRTRRAWMITVPMLFVALERWFPALFPFPLAAALYPVPLLLQTAELAGGSAPGFLVMLVSCGLVDAVEQLVDGRGFAWRPAAAILAAWLAAVAWGANRMAAIRGAPPRASLTAALVQPNATIEEKTGRAPGGREALWARTARLVRAAAAAPDGAAAPDLIVLPEGGFPFTFEPGAPELTPTAVDSASRRFSRDLYRLARETGADLVAGAATRGREHPRNSAVHIAPPARRAVVYDKVRLVPFSERVPFADRFPALRTAVRGMHHQEPGTARPTLRVAGVGLAPSICYEAIFPGDTRRALNAGGADVLLNLTNDVWFGDTSENEQHLMLQILRAIEDRVWLLRGANFGISAFVDPTGAVRARSRVGRRETLALRVEVPDIGHPFHRRHGDLPLVLACLVAGGLATAARRDGVPAPLRRR